MAKKQYRLPERAKIRRVDFPKLDGGLNLSDAEFRLPSNESPEMTNLWWDDGVLRSRHGQEYVTAAPETGRGYAMTAFQGCLFLHIGDTLCFADCRDGPGEDGWPVRELTAGVPQTPGTFFRSGDFLFYKNQGGFFRIEYRADRPDDPFVPYHPALESAAYVPTVTVNASPLTGIGDPCQPDNRLTPRRRVTYNPLPLSESVTLEADGIRRIFTLDTDSLPLLRGVRDVYAGTSRVNPALYDANPAAGTVTFSTAPAAGTVLTFLLDIGNREYHLPVREIDAVVEIRVDGRVLNPETDYSVEPVTGVVTFTNPPPASNTGNSVEIVYRKNDPEIRAALESFLDCPFLAACTGGTHACLVTGGGTISPGAVFWSASADTGPDFSYWPVSSVLQAGGVQQTVTGFGSQYGQLTVFQSHSIGKLSLATRTANGLESPILSYTALHDRIGCDLPRSIRLIENNLVFCNTEGGVYFIRGASAARENGIVCVSRKINGSNTGGQGAVPGLLETLRTAGDSSVSSHDDGTRYLLAVNGTVWAWDYRASRWDNPAWFRLTDMYPMAWASLHGITYHLNEAGRVTRLGNTLSDYGEPIRKFYRFPLRDFGEYGRLKEVLSVFVSLRDSSPGTSSLTYETDCGTRTDPVPLTVGGGNGLIPRDLSYRDLSVPRCAKLFRRCPRCRHIRLFSMRLENDRAGEDLAIFAAQIQYRLTGSEK